MQVVHVRVADARFRMAFNTTLNSNVETTQRPYRSGILTTVVPGGDVQYKAYSKLVFWELFIRGVYVRYAV